MEIQTDFIREVGAFRWLRRTFLRQFSKRILRRDSTIVLPTGLRMTLPKASKFASEVFITNCHVDWGSEELFSNHLNPSGVVLDVGANVGYYSLYLLPKVADVHAFEPDPRALVALRANVGGHPNAHVHCMAVSNRRGKARFTLAQDSEVSRLVDPSLPGGGESQEIDVTTIDDFVADRRLSVTGIKIDVEGADMLVLEGALNTLASQFPLVLTETSPDNRLMEMLHPFDYRVFAFVLDPGSTQIQFRELHGNTKMKTKMLFLAPPRLHWVFEQAAKEHGRSGG